MTIRSGKGFRDGSSGSQRNDTNLQKLSESVKSTVSNLSTRVDTLTTYTPADDADWDNEPPATIQEALDRLARKVTPVPVL